MPKVNINTQAPDFSINDFKGEPIKLSLFKNKSSRRVKKNGK